tara:strand:+ start:201 stop:500 length:300 start_codon:yes stop_codon:yes gene_type:complete
MSEVKRGRGRPRLSDEERKAREKEYRKKNALKSRNVTASVEATKILWDCVVVMSVKIGVKLTISQVITLLLNDWLAENDPTGELRKDERYINDKERRTI